MLTRFAVKNYQLTIVAFVMIVILGVKSFINMPRSEDPPLSGNYFYVLAVYPGASPKDMEQLVVDPLEESINELDDIKKINSTIHDGMAVININFTSNAKGEKKYDELLRQVNSIRNKLPQDINSLEVYRWTTTNVNILQYALVSEEATYSDLEERAEMLKKKIETITTVKKVEITAHPDQQIRIEVDLQKMAQKGIILNNVIGAIQSNNSNIPGGDIDMDTRKFNIKTTASYQNVKDIGNTIIHSGNGNVVFLKDIASINQDYSDQTHIGRFQGKKAIFLMISQKEEANILQVVKAVDKNAKVFSSNLPGYIKLEKAFDQSLNVSSRLNGLYRDFGLAILIIMFTLLPLGTRASIIVMIAIPASLLIGLLFIYLTGHTLNQLTIVGLVISLGLLVDDSIVVVENITRFMRNGYSRYDAIIKATKQISMAVLGCTATMIVAFVPIIMVPGESGEFMRSLPVAVTFTLLASLLVSFTLTPYMASRLLKEKEFKNENRFFHILNAINNGPYQKLLLLGLRYPAITILISIICVFGSLMLLPVVGFSLFPKAEKPQFFINIETPSGSNISYTDSVARSIEKVLHNKTEILSFCTNVGKGNPMVYYNLIQANEQSNFAQFFVQLKSYDHKTTPVFINQLRKELSCFPGIRVTLKEFQNGSPSEAPIEIAFKGPNLDTLKQLAQKGENLLKQTKGTTTIRNPVETTSSDLRISINKYKAGMFGVPVHEIQKAVRMSTVGIPIDVYTNNEGKDFNMVLTLAGNKRKNITDLDKIYVNSASGAQIPLKHLASMEFKSSLSLIEHYNRERRVTVRANVLPGYLTDNVTKQIVKKLKNFKLPGGYEYEMLGEYADRTETFNNMSNAFIITIFIIMIILILEFHNIRGALIVASSIPLGIIGSIVLLFLTGFTFSFSAFVGMISLIGIEVKNSIILVDYANQQRQNGMGIDEAIQTAGQIRFIPIILTTLTAIGGLLPLAIERSEFFSPLAITIIGGLISSTLFTRIVTPVLYKLLLSKMY